MVSVVMLHLPSMRRAAFAIGTDAALIEINFTRFAARPAVQRAPDEACGKRATAGAGADAAS
jgi:hypothetical protein